MARVSTVPDFDRLYLRDPDPWRVASSWYERRKNDLLLACLRRERYRLAWDLGCGTGELAAQLARRCDRVVATDSSRRACGITARRCAGHDNVTVQHSAAPELPAALTSDGAAGADCATSSGALGKVDLVVISEVLYYLRAPQRRAALEAVLPICAPGADLVAVHWTARPEDARASGLKVHRELDEALLGAGWGRLIAHRDLEFTLTLWSSDVPTTMGR